MLEFVSEAEFDLKSLDFGILDSGVGGVAVVKSLVKQNPDASFCYIADRAHFPYGERDPENVYDYCEAVARFFYTNGISTVVLACNTASADALYNLRRRYPDMSFVGMEPAVKPAAKVTGTGRIGVIATTGTLQGEPYAGVLERFGKDIQIYTNTCADLVPLAEEGEWGSPESYETVRRELAPLLEKDIDVLVLGCTHFSIIKPLIQRVVGPDITIVDPSDAVASRALQLRDNSAAPPLKQHKLAPEQFLLSTADPEHFRSVVAEVLAEGYSVGRARWHKR